MNLAHVNKSANHTSLAQVISKSYASLVQEIFKLHAIRAEVKLLIIQLCRMKMTPIVNKHY